MGGSLDDRGWQSPRGGAGGAEGVGEGGFIVGLEVPAGFARGNDFGKTAVGRDDGGDTANNRLDGDKALGFGPKRRDGDGPCLGIFAFDVTWFPPAKKIDSRGDV